MPRLILCVLLILGGLSLETAAQQSFANRSDSLLPYNPYFRLPQNFYIQHLGFFCRKEDQIQKRTKLPLYFRLGSKAYVDYLERKPNAVKGF